MAQSETYTITAEINNFSFNEKPKPTPYNFKNIAPELLYEKNLVLCGISSKHPTFEDGDNITTSPIYEIKNGLVFTRSGSCYKLLEPNDDYKIYCNQNNLKIYPDDKIFD